MNQRITRGLLRDLERAVGTEGVRHRPEEMLVFESDAVMTTRALPSAVVFPKTAGEVSAVVRILSRAVVPFVARGAGTGLSGGAVACREAVVIELARLNRIRLIDAPNRRAVVETGVVNIELTRAVEPFGLHYAPDPSSQAACTIGGNVAENAGGPHCLKHGMTAQHILALEVVLPDGEIVTLERDGRGYDLAGLFIGSEGTFGIATAATVVLTPVAEAVETVLADFVEVEAACRAVSAVIAAGILPAALEMMDGAAVRAAITGMVRGLIHDGIVVREGEKLGDIDPRPDAPPPETISDKSRAIAGGALEAILAGLLRRGAGVRGSSCRC
jgi:FAD/FMN-containing dehydrogenase